MLKQFAKLVDLKSIISLALVGVTCFGFVVDKISPETFMGLTMAVVTYYFTRKDNQ